MAFYGSATQIENLVYDNATGALKVEVLSGGGSSTSATGTKTNVASSAASVTILASNASRKSAVIYNDSTAVLYLDLTGGTASNSSYTVQLAAGGFFELPIDYTGLITGLWASVNGNARVTEFS